MDGYIIRYQNDPIKTKVLDNIAEIESNYSENTGLSIIHINIRSIEKNLDEFLVYISQLSNPPECIVLSETRNVINPKDFSIKGYNNFYNYGGINKNDGTMVYLKEHLIICNHENIELNSFNFISLNFKFYGQKVTLLAIYRPPSTSPQLFLDSLELLYKQNENMEKNCIIFVGDINIDILSINDDIANEYLNLQNEYGLIPVINVPTREQGLSSSCIDHIFVKTKTSPEKLTPAVIRCNITDHYCTFLRISTNQNNEIKREYI